MHGIILSKSDLKLLRKGKCIDYFVDGKRLRLQKGYQNMEKTIQNVILIISLLVQIIAIVSYLFVNKTIDDWKLSSMIQASIGILWIINWRIKGQKLMVWRSDCKPLNKGLEIVLSKKTLKKIKELLREDLGVE